MTYFPTVNASDGLTRNQRAALQIIPTSWSLPTHRGFRNLTGLKFTSLAVLRFAFEKSASGGRRFYWSCLCDCGQWAVAETYALTSGKTRSCGCRLSKVTAARNVSSSTHGESRYTTEYLAWTAMKSRCSPKNKLKRHIYFDRGISVCDRWANSYQAFLHDMGRRPPGKSSIDRIDGTKGYKPGNCRWADIYEQNQNRDFSR